MAAQMRAAAPGCGLGCGHQRRARTITATPRGRVPLLAIAFHSDEHGTKAKSTEEKKSVVQGRDVLSPDLRVTEHLGRSLEQLLTRPRRGLAVAEAKAPLRPWSYQLDEPLGTDEVEIRVTHNGLCHTDVHMQNDDWGLSKYPFIPGHEVVGEVVAVGAGVQLLRPGQRAGVGWIRSSCRRCMYCLRGEENTCVRGYTGLIVNGGLGGFQELLRVPADFTYSIPDGLDSASAAPLLCAGVTVYSPLRRHITFPGMHVGVMGVGGLGHLALQFASKMGAQVTALDVDAAKAEEAQQLGAHDFSTWADATKDGSGYKARFDLLLNCASANIPTPQLMALLQVNGTLVQVGIPGGAQMTVPLQDLVFGQKKVAGTIVGGRADMQEMLEFCATHNIKPMVETMPLSQIDEAIERLLSGKARYRIVLTSDWDQAPLQQQAEGGESLTQQLHQHMQQSGSGAAESGRH